jgi:hypothetical protein
LGSAGAEREVDDARERGRRDARERDEGEDAPARRALNDTPDPIRDGCADRHERRGEERAAKTERPVPDDRGGDAETEAGERPPAPAYRRRAAKWKPSAILNRSDAVSAVVVLTDLRGYAAATPPIPAATTTTPL